MFITISYTDLRILLFKNFFWSCACMLLFFIYFLLNLISLVSPLTVEWCMILNLLVCSLHILKEKIRIYKDKNINII